MPNNPKYHWYFSNVKFLLGLQATCYTTTNKTIYAVFTLEILPDER